MLLAVVIFSLFVCLNIKLVNGHASFAGLTFELPDNENFCFQEDFEGSQVYRFEFRVIEGGNYDVDVSLESPGGKYVYKETKKESDSITFETSWGTYKLCFSNEFSTITHKKIYFIMRPEEHELLAAEGGRIAPGANTLIETAMEKIHSMCTSVMHTQTQYRLNESKGRHAADRLSTHVQWWSVSQAVVVMLTGFGQVFILRRFFTDKRTIMSNPYLNMRNVNIPPPSTQL